ncbi:MAG: ABC transporter substrate-binding protein [Alphaproteobacteria bacterium]|nr:ABC transporter substrate-binding protein [Alphaproteobacteria bacterium]
MLGLSAFGTGAENAPFGIKPAQAAEAAAPAVADFSQDASQQMDELIQTGQAILRNRSASDAAKVEDLQKLIIEGFDVNAVGRFLLGSYWRTATEAERAEFIALIKTITVAGYSARFNDYSQYRYENKGAKMDGKSALVYYQVIRPNNPTPINLQWRLIKSSDRPKIVDAIVEGISLGVTQQQEFGSIIASRGKGVQGLLEEIRARIAKKSLTNR